LLLPPGTTLSRIPAVGIEASVFEVEPKILSGNAPEKLESRSILLSRLHCGEKSLLPVKFATLGISIRATAR